MIPKLLTHPSVTWIDVTYSRNLIYPDLNQARVHFRTTSYRNAVETAALDAARRDRLHTQKHLHNTRTKNTPPRACAPPSIATCDETKPRTRVTRRPGHDNYPRTYHRARKQTHRQESVQKQPPLTAKRRRPAPTPRRRVACDTAAIPASARTLSQATTACNTLKPRNATPKGERPAAPPGRDSSLRQYRRTALLQGSMLFRARGLFVWRHRTLRLRNFCGAPDLPPSPAAFRVLAPSHPRLIVLHSLSASYQNPFSFAMGFKTWTFGQGKPSHKTSARSSD